MPARLHPPPPATCATCEIEIVGRALFHADVPYCCAGCVAGGPCTCSYDPAPVELQVRECLDVARAGPGTASSRFERVA